MWVIVPCAAVKTHGSRPEQATNGRLSGRIAVVRAILDNLRLIEEGYMSTAEIVEGTLMADGTLELDQKPSLAPGRVQIIVQPLVPLAGRRRGLADAIEEIKQEQLARGYKGRTREEMEAEEAARREDEDDYDQRMQQLWSQTQSGPLPGNA